MRKFICLQISDVTHPNVWRNALCGMLDVEAIKMFVELKTYRPSWQFLIHDNELAADDVLEECFGAGNYQSPRIKMDIAKLHERVRSMSVGDVVRCEETGEAWLCASVGWEKLP